MSWKEDFKRDCVRAAIPKWESHDSDEIQLSFSMHDDYDHTEGGDYKEWVDMRVEVHRPGTGKYADAYVSGNDPVGISIFLNRLLG
jgi:hypothetical protein